MTELYRGLESSMLGIGLVLGLAVAAAFALPHSVERAAITLPMIEVQADR